MSEPNIETWMVQGAALELRHYDSLDSTNLQALRLSAQRPPAAPILAVTADVQTHGLGRSGRSWLSPLGGVWLSLVWPLRQNLEAYQALPLVIGLATVHALAKSCQLDCRIKWPNDILVADRKIAGILCQGEPALPTPAIIIGVGINANFPTAQLGPGLRHPPTTLQEELQTDTDLPKLRTGLIAEILRALIDFENNQWDTDLRPAIDRLLAWRGQAVTCTDAQGHAESGILQGLNAAGHIILQNNHGLITAATGELRRQRHTGQTP